jgi:hypothetical protein
MSLDNIPLPAPVLHDLYKNALVDMGYPQTGTVFSQKVKLAYLGENNKQVILLVNNAEAIYLPEHSLNFLLGILGACNLNMADVALLNISKNPSCSYTKLKEELGAEKIFLFGLNADAIDLPLQVPHYQIQKYNQQVYIMAPDLDTIERNKEEKMKLWNCLKQVFNLG